MKNQLYYGDNLDILRDHIADDSVDLIYLDPPFNSDRNYNVLFKEKSGESSPSQLEAFTDTWQWNQDAEYAYNELTTNPPAQVASMIEAMRSFIGTNDMMAYLVMMAQRLLELHRVLKPTGTLYLHCDPTASHYLKMVLDTIFGKKRFLNEVTWKRSSAHSDTKQGMRRYGKIRDVLLIYTKSDIYTWNPQYTAYDLDYLESEYRHVAPDGRRYKETDCTAAKPGGDTEYEWRVKRKANAKERWVADLTDEYLSPQPGMEYRGVRPYIGRYWGYSRDNLVAFAKAGKLIHRETGMPRQMQFADEMPGVSLQDLWDDISPASGGEDLGYPTQKPLALLERIIEASSTEGDVVLDPFCGCGTAVAAAQKLNRRWIGIDITHLAVSLIRTRLIDHFGAEIADQIEVHGEPKDLGAARALFAADPFQFEWWALALVKAMPANDKKKGADKGVDGIVRFHVDTSGKARKAIVQVKGGKVQAHYIRDLRGTMTREKANMAILVTLQRPTSAMMQEAATAGVYTTPLGAKYPAIQIITVEDLLDGKQPKLPHAQDTFSRASRINTGKQATLDLGPS